MNQYDDYILVLSHAYSLNLISIEDLKKYVDVYLTRIHDEVEIKNVTRLFSSIDEFRASKDSLTIFYIVALVANYNEIVKGPKDNTEFKKIIKKLISEVYNRKSIDPANLLLERIKNLFNK